MFFEDEVDTSVREQTLRGLDAFSWMPTTPMAIERRMPLLKMRWAPPHL